MKENISPKQAYKKAYRTYSKIKSQHNLVKLLQSSWIRFVLSTILNLLSCRAHNHTLLPSLPNATANATNDAPNDERQQHNAPNDDPNQRGKAEPHRRPQRLPKRRPNLLQRRSTSTAPFISARREFALWRGQIFFRYALIDTALTELLAINDRRRLQTVTGSFIIISFTGFG